MSTASTLEIERAAGGPLRRRHRCGRPPRVRRDLGAEKVRAFGRPDAVIFDVKGVFAKHESDGRL